MAGRVIDLSLKMQTGMPVYPGDMPVTIEPFHKTAEHGTNSTRIELSSHTGTHLDAPWHFLADGRRVDEISPDRCVGPAVVLDLSHKGQEGIIDLADLKRSEHLITEGARVLLRTDWGRRYGTPSYYEGWPALSDEAASWLAGRGIWLLGMETPSVDRRHHRECHDSLLGADIVLVEGLTNLSALRGTRVFFIALPLALVGRDGSPVRAVAMEDEFDLGGLKTMAATETLQEATPYSASHQLGLAPTRMFRQLLRS